MTREEAIQILADLIDSPFLHTWEKQNKALHMAIEALSADRQYGEWIKTADGNGWNEWWVFKCPFCGAIIEDKQRRSWEYNFCPSCGAKMIKDGDDTTGESL